MKKISISKKINNLSYSSLKKWEKSYLKKIEEINTNLSFAKFKQKKDEVDELIVKTEPISEIIEEIQSYKTNFKLEVSYLKKKVFWYPDKGFIVGNLFCENENKMSNILKKIKDAKLKRSKFIPYNNYMNELQSFVNISKVELEVEEYIPQYFSDTIVRNSFDDRILSYFYKNPGLYYNNFPREDHNQIDFWHGQNFVSTPVIINKLYDGEFCTIDDLNGVDTRVEIFMVGNFFKELKAINIEYIPIPEFPNEEIFKKYNDLILDKANKDLRKIQLRIRSFDRSFKLSSNQNFIYVMSNQSLPNNTYKIGWTSILPEERAEELSSTGVLYDFKVVYQKKFKNAEKIEGVIHNHFKNFRLRKNREFFEVKLNKIIKFIESL